MTTHPLKEVFEAAERTIALSSRDWSKSRGDAWLYGIFVGWPNDALAEIAQEHDWAPTEVERLVKMRQAVVTFLKS